MHVSRHGGGNVKMNPCLSDFCKNSMMSPSTRGKGNAFILVDDAMLDAYFDIQMLAIM